MTAHFVATLIAADRATLDAPQAAAAIENAGGRVLSTLWIEPDEALDLCFAGGDPIAVRDDIEAAVAGQPIDVAVQPVADRRKKLIVADMDSTIIGVECIDELADFAGIKEHVAAITEAAMQGKLDFNAALKERVALLKGLPVAVLERCYQERVRLNPGARTLIATMRHHGAYAALVSGGFTFFADRVGQAAGFDLVRANILGVVGEKLNGLVVPPISNAATKLATLERLIVERGVPRALTLAVGDGANDIPMLESAGFGAAYHAKPKAEAAAAMRIRHGGLEALLFAQGYARAQFRD